MLSDAWFTSHAFIKTIQEIKDGAVHVIAGIRNDKRKYMYDGQLFSAKEIITQLKTVGSEHRCRKWNVCYYEAVVHYEGIGDVKLFMCRYPHQRKWRVFITTNTTLSFVEMMKIYGIRWTIEVMFRETKQHLQLDKVFVAFIALILSCHIHNTMKKNEFAMSFGKLLVTLSKIKVATINDRLIIRPLTKEQRSIFDCFDVPYPQV